MRNLRIAGGSWGRVPSLPGHRSERALSGSPAASSSITTTSSTPVRSPLVMSSEVGRPSAGCPWAGRRGDGRRRRARRGADRRFGHGSGSGGIGVRPGLRLAVPAVSPIGLPPRRRPRRGARANIGPPGIEIALMDHGCKTTSGFPPSFDHVCRRNFDLGLVDPGGVDDPDRGPSHHPPTSRASGPELTENSHAASTLIDDHPRPLLASPEAKRAVGRPLGYGGCSWGGWGRPQSPASGPTPGGGVYTVDEPTRSTTR